MATNQSENTLVQFQYTENKDGKWKCQFHDPHGHGEMSGDQIDDHSKLFVQKELTHELAFQSGIEFPFMIVETIYTTKRRWFKKQTYRSLHYFSLYSNEDLKEFFTKAYDPQQFYSIFTLAMHSIRDVKTFADQLILSNALDNKTIEIEKM